MKQITELKKELKKLGEGLKCTCVGIGWDDPIYTGYFIRVSGNNFGRVRVLTSCEYINARFVDDYTSTFNDEVEGATFELRELLSNNNYLVIELVYRDEYGEDDIIKSFQICI